MANEENLKNIERSFNRLKKVNEVSPKFCGMKWTSTTLNLGNGHCQSCPLTKSTRVKPYSISDQPLELYNTPKIKNDRQMMINNEWPEDCHVCNSMESKSSELISPRQVNSTNDQIFPEVESLNKAQILNNRYPTVLELSFSNKCNMKCIYCSPESSSSWLDEVRELGSYPSSEGEHDLRWLELENRLPIVNEQKNPYVDAFINSWDELYPNLKELKLTGGEPLIMDEVWECLDLIESVPNKNLALKIHSNLNVDQKTIDMFIDKVNKILPQIKSFELLTSCEATGRQAEYIRDGLNYNNFIKNLDTILGRTPETFKATVVITANILSYSTLTKFMQEVLFYRKKHTTNIANCRLHFYLNPISWPPFLKLENLDSKMKSNLAFELNMFIKQFKIPEDYGHNGYLYLEEINQIKNLIFRLKDELETDELLRNKKNFNLFVTEFDKRRGKEFKRVFPELVQLYQSSEGTLTENILPTQKIKDKADLVSLEHSTDFARDHVVINWCLTSVCNYRCSYCPEDLHNGKIKGPELSEMKRIVDSIADHYEKKIFFEFTGGEVTFYKYFDELIDYIKSKGCDVGILSNGSRPLDWWEKRIDKLDHVCLTLHNEFVKADHFFEVIKFICGRVTTHVNIMMDPKNFEFCHDFAKKIGNEIFGVSIAIQPILKGMIGEVVDYTKEQLTILENQNIYKNPNALIKALSSDKMKIYRGHMKQTFQDGRVKGVDTAELIANKQNNWNGYRCYAGIENLVIEINGNVYRGWCKIGGEVGNIYDKNIEFPSKPITCNIDYCHCGLDIMCTKEKI